jgi:hypothetical protein
MSRPAKRRGLILWLAVRLAALGGILGYLALVVAAALLGVVAMARLWRRVRRPVRRVPGDR